MRHLKTLTFLGSLLVGVVAGVVFRKVRRRKQISARIDEVIHGKTSGEK